MLASRTVVRQGRRLFSSRAAVTATNPATLRGAHNAALHHLGRVPTSLNVTVRALSVMSNKLLSSKQPAPKGVAQQQVASGWEANIRGLTNLTGERDDSWWTGKKPSECPGLGPDGRLYSMPLPNLAECTRQDLVDYFDNTWTLTEALFASLQTETPFYKPPYHHLRHPKIFYYAHTASVYVNKLRVAGLLVDPINAYYEHIFETGVDEMKWDDMSKNDMMWPSVDEVKEYRKQVYNTVKDIILTHPDFETAPKLEKSKFWSVALGFEHERIHLETSSVLMRELPIDTVRNPQLLAPYHPSAAKQTAKNPTEGVDYPKNEFIPVPGRRVKLGKPRDFPSFGWDNEYGNKVMEVKPFKASKFKVTNGEFWQFLKSGGYAQEKYWSSEGWQWRTFGNIKWPTFWKPTGPTGLHQYKLRLLFDEVDMQWDYPAIVNYHEAKAYCAWRNEQEQRKGGAELRILTEAEHKCLADDSISQLDLGVARDPVMILPGYDFPRNGANLNLAFTSESPVTAHQPSSAGFYDSFGNVWEWCEDHLSPLPGFKIHQYYEDFSLPCFDAQHNIIAGGSFISTGDEASIFARFHFRPHFYQHAGFRLVEPNPEDPALVTSCMDNQGPFVGNNPYRKSKEADHIAAKYSEQQTLGQFMHLHFASASSMPATVAVPQYAEQTLAWIQQAVQKNGCKTGRVLDLGCGPGGIAFQLSKVFDDVQALDLSESFIAAGETMKKKGAKKYTIQADGDLQDEYEAVLPAGTRADRVHFKQGDATCISPDSGLFDAVLLSNLLDRLPSPRAVLSRMGGDMGLVKTGGLLFITCPFTWERQFTPKELWLGGYVDEETGQTVKSMDGLKAVLEQSFDLVDTTTIPCLIRDHKNKYQLLLNEGSVWRKK